METLDIVPPAFVVIAHVVDVVANVDPHMISVDDMHAVNAIRIGRGNRRGQVSAGDTAPFAVDGETSTTVAETPLYSRTRTTPCS